MPYKDKQVKAEHMRGYMREYMRAKRHPMLSPVKSPIVPIPGLIMDGNRIIGVDKTAAPTMPVQPSNRPALYNPMFHRVGETVIVSGKVVTVPELDADGHIIY